MTPAARRVRIAIASPDMLGQIRRILAGRNLAVEIVHPPSVEVTVMPTAGARPAPVAAPASRRLHAEYRLHVVDVDTAQVPDNGGPPVNLSRRQREVMALVSAGVRNREIAARLGLSEKTVKNHINRIFRSLGAASRVEAVLVWQRYAGATRRAGPAVGRRPASAGTP